MRDLATGQEKSVVEAISRPQWSRDGQFLLGSTPGDRIVVCPAASGACKMITRGNRPKWSGDGSRIYFLRATQSRELFEPWSASHDGSDEKKIARLGPFSLETVHFDVSANGQVVWTPFRQGRQELWLAEIR